MIPGTEIGRQSEQLMLRIGELGVEKGAIVEYLLSLKGLLLVKPRMDSSQINTRLDDLGWPGFRLDDQTMELAIACFELK